MWMHTVAKLMDIASVPDRAEPAAGVWWDVEMLAGISAKLGENCSIELFPRSNGGVWCFSASVFVDAVNLAISNH